MTAVSGVAASDSVKIAPKNSAKNARSKMPKTQRNNRLGKYQGGGMTYEQLPKTHSSGISSRCKVGPCYVRKIMEKVKREKDS